MRFRTLLLGSLMAAIPSLAAASTIDFPKTGNTDFVWGSATGTTVADHQDFLSNFVGVVGDQQNLENVAVESNGTRLTEAIDATTAFSFSFTEVLLDDMLTRVFGSNASRFVYVMDAPAHAKNGNFVAVDAAEFGHRIHDDGWHGEPGNEKDPISTPEPATLLLIGTGLAGLALRRRVKPQA